MLPCACDFLLVQWQSPCTRPRCNARGPYASFHNSCIISRIARPCRYRATRRTAAPLGPDAICAEIVMYDASLVSQFAPRALVAAVLAVARVIAQIRPPWCNVRGRLASCEGAHCVVFSASTHNLQTEPVDVVAFVAVTWNFLGGEDSKRVLCQTGSLKLDLWQLA